MHGVPRLVCLAVAALLAACSGTLAAERSLRRARRAEVDADGMIRIRGGRLHAVDGRTVDIPAFDLDATEVTVAAYRRCVAAGACLVDRTRGTRGCNLARLYVDEHPINCVDFAEAEAYCRWRGTRLPTRDEWQWAAQGRGLASRYVWGQYPRRRVIRWRLPDFEPFVCGEAATEPHVPTKTCTVGRHDRTRDGVADLTGNVQEWVRVDPPARPCEGPGACDAYAVGLSYDYPFGYGNRPVEGYDIVRDLVIYDRARGRDATSPEIGFRCARSLEVAP